MQNGRRRRMREDVIEKDQDLERTIMPGMSEGEIERIVRYRVKKRQDKQREFIIHLGIFVIVNIGLWILWAEEGGFPWPLLVMGGWGIGVFAHFMELTQSTSGAQSRRDRIIQQEVEREKERLGLYEKPKRESLEKRKPMRVSDDGELQPLDDLLADDERADEDDELRYRQNSNNSRRN